MKSKIKRLTSEEFMALYTEAAEADLTELWIECLRARLTETFWESAYRETLRAYCLGIGIEES